MFNKNALVFLLLLFSFGSASLSGKEEIAINNRILAKVHGNPITLFDVVKKLDLLFYRQFPEYAASTPARYEFYNARWKDVLDEIIRKDLILLDAEENKLQVSTGEVREEMERIFGPNIVINLEKAKLSFDEAFKLVFNDLTMKRMLFIRVHAKVNRKISPEQVHSYYENWAKENVEEEKWRYRVLTLRSLDPQKSLTAATSCFETFQENTSLPLETLTENLQKTFPDVQLGLSQELEGTSSSLSEPYRAILMPLKPKDLAKPALQDSRKLGTVVRLFYLIDHHMQGAPTFEKVETLLRSELMEKATDDEFQTYFTKLKQRFDVEETWKVQEKEFMPFMLSFSGI